MKPQNYSNHTRYYAPHHFIFYPVIIILLAVAIKLAISHSGHACEWYAIAVLLFLIGWLSFMLRQHYALNNQNRIVRLEMRLRYYQLTQQRLEDIEPQLSFAQLAALRFASDSELPSLIKRTLAEHLSPADIKKSIQNWLPDHMRV